MKLILDASDSPTAAEAGGKAAALARLAAAGLPIPTWCVLSPRAFDESLTANQHSALSKGELDLSTLTVAPHVADAIRHALDSLGGEGPFAVRSSAVDEDGSQHSFAGQLESYLFVSPDRVIDRVVDVWRSGFAERVLAYRRERGLGPPSPPAVLIQRMIDADISGVAFAADPIGGSRSTVIVSAVFGLGTSLVGGEAEADTFRLTHAGEIVEQRIARKSIRHIADPEAASGVRAIDVADIDADKPTLSADDLQRVADLVLAVSRLERRPQDIEWAIRNGELFLLQSRPITSLASVADPAGALAIWDNSNIAESYNGVTTPLTFSFAQRAYEGAYRQFCKLMKVPRRVVADNDAMFRQMLGLIRGRVYYNLLNWYRLLAMLPGYSVNGKFMEQMMGVREGLPPEIASSVVARTWPQRQSDRLRLAWSVGGLAWNHFRLPSKIRSFYARLNNAMAAPAPPLAQMRLDQLVAEFRTLERQLLTRWDAPLINDFLAMIFFGVLGKTTAKWTNAENLHNDLLGDEGGIISIEPVRRINEMAAIAVASPALVESLSNDAASSAVGQINAMPPLAAKYRSYLDQFGDRCLEELKLESSTLTDDPTPLLRTIGAAAKRLSSGGEAPKPFRPREAAEAKVAAALRRKPLRRLLHRWILRNARRRVRDRENLRFERTRLFGRVRRIFVEVGRRLVAEGRLSDERDIFYLTLEEILGFVEGTGCDGDLIALTTRRAAEFAAYRAGPPPADRFETRGAVAIGNAFTAATSPATSSSSHTLRGVGCCPGIVRGAVRVIRDPRGAHLRDGEILVAERTDPGWIMLFPAAAGVLVERGSLLSHSAIVARELGIPAIVSVPDLLNTLEDGDVVEMNGATGVIRLGDLDAEPLPPPPPPADASATEAAGRADFNAIRYAQCWEDADVLLDALDVHEGNVCLSIASAGDNSFSLLTRNPSKVVAVDLNSAQLACVWLRKAAYANLTHEELLRLIGAAEGDDRASLYSRCRDDLPEETRQFWDARPQLIAAGIGSGGKFERYFATFRTRVLPWIHSRRRVDELLADKPLGERRTFYDQHWNTLRWRLMFKLFFSRFVMGRLGRDPAFFQYVEGSVGSRILARARHALIELNPADNPYLQWILIGRYTTALPHALRPENFEAIRRNLDRLEIRLGSIEQYLAAEPGVRIDRFNLSDIFEYMSEANTESLLGTLASRANVGGRLVYWNMLVPRSRPPSLAGRLESIPGLGDELLTRDKAFFYSRLVVEEVR